MTEPFTISQMTLKRVAYATLCVPVVLMALKATQHFFQGADSITSAARLGFRYRIDDPSFWASIGIALACLIITALVKKVSGAEHASVNVTGRVKFGVGWGLLVAAMYVVMMYSRRETIFYQGSGAVVAVQLIEGIVLAALIFVGAGYAGVGLELIKSSQHLSRSLARDVGVSLLAAVTAVILVSAVPLALVELVLGSDWSRASQRMLQALVVLSFCWLPLMVLLLAAWWQLAREVNDS